MTGCCQVTTAIDDEPLAAALAAAIVEERLAACAQVTGPVESTYRWEGSVRRAREWLVVAKTTDLRLDELLLRIRALHRYSVPEIVALPISAGDPAYLSWIRQETTLASPEAP